MPASRGSKKRAASPAADGDLSSNAPTGSAGPPAAKRARRGKATASLDDNDDDVDDDQNNNAAPTAKKQAKAKANGTSKAAKTQNGDGDDATNKPPKSKAKGKASAKATLADSSAQVKDEDQADAGATDSVIADKPDEAPKVSEAQFAKSKNLRVALDEECHLSSYSVYVGSDSIVWDAALNQTSAGNNHNKFYKIQLLTDGSDFKTWTRWGRVGVRGQSKVLGNGTLHDAQSNFEKKFKEKTGLEWEDRGFKPLSSKYVFIERSYEPDSDDEDGTGAKTKAQSRVSKSSPPKCTLKPAVKSLMELIFNQQFFEQVMQDLNYDVKKLPLGKLSKGTISRGYQALKDLAALLNDASLAASVHGTDYLTAVEQLSNLYYSYIPHVFGFTRPPVISTHNMITSEIDLMNSLTDLKEADQIIKAEKDDVEEVHPLDARFAGLGIEEMSPVAVNSEEFKELSQYLTKTCGQTHSMNYEVQDIFRIQRQGEPERYQQSKIADAGSDRRLLWHGSMATNYGGILSQGLRIAPPEAPVSGYMFGKGIYLADMSSKSANYCRSHTSGGEALLLLCEAELGKPMQALTAASSSAGEDALAKGIWSTWGRGSFGPKGWKDAECVHPSLKGVSMPDTAKPPGQTDVPVTGLYGNLYYNEYICYDVAQVRLRYLLRVKT